VIAVYAIGGGAGHVTRARRVVETLGINAVILATPTDHRATGSIPLIEIPRALEGDVTAHRAWLRTIARDYDRLIVDTFPAGIQGELSGFADLPLDFVGRLLRVDEYRRATNDAPWPSFETAYVVEEGAPAVTCARVVQLDLAGPQPMSGAPDVHAPRGYWLIVHSGPAEEVQELINYAVALREVERSKTKVLVATACDVAMPEDFTRVDAFPATPLFAAAARIVSAAGFNVMLETEPWRDKHVVLPFARRFDDQFARAARRKTRVKSGSTHLET
jgi:hypothetical protein